MSLTEHLRQYLASNKPDVALLASLAELIRERIWKSGMWEQPPDYFGYPEYHSWREAFAADDPSPGPAGDFFLEEIVRDRSFLEETIQAGNAIDAWMRQRIKWFLIDRQKKHDPIGYRVFKNLTAVLEAMIADGSATATNQVQGKLRNQSLIRLKSVEPGSLAGEPDLARLIDTDPEWQPVLLRLAKLGKGAQQLLRERLVRLSSAGVDAFSVGDLAAILKAKVRALYEAWNRPSECTSTGSPTTPENPDEFRTDAPDERYGDGDEHLDSLRREVPEAVERSEYISKVKRGMLVVFEDWLNYLQMGRDHPPLREWAAQLGLPKSSLGDYLNRLRLVIRGILEKRRAE